MESVNLTIFDTPIGACGLAWSARAICGVQLPERDAEKTAARLASRFPDASVAEPSGPAASAIGEIIALLEGEPRPLTDIRIDEQRLTDFDRAVYRAARAVLPGSTATYGAIAAAIGRPREARAVGQSLGRNPFPIIVPCHRILAAGGRTGGFSGAGGLDTKFRMLVIEKATTDEGPGLFDAAELPLVPRLSK